jgi:hypothetical protein
VLAGLAALVLTALVITMVLVLRGGDPGGGPAVAPQSPTPTQTPSASASTSPPTGSTTVTATTSIVTTATSTRVTAFSQLGPFFTAASRMDTLLRTAAAKINTAGPPWYVLSEEVASSVRAANLEDVSVIIPGGMPTALRRSVMLVYSELASRRAAMNNFDIAHGFESPPPSVESNRSTEALLSQLKHGHEAASRFSTDVAAARDLASSTASFATAALGSRADMEVHLLTNYVFKANFGCASTGGAILEELPVIVWESATSGTINSLPFVIRLEPSGEYTEDPINVC